MKYISKTYPRVSVGALGVNIYFDPRKHLSKNARYKIASFSEDNSNYVIKLEATDTGRSPTLKAKHQPNIFSLQFKDRSNGKLPYFGSSPVLIQDCTITIPKKTVNPPDQRTLNFLNKDPDDTPVIKEKSNPELTVNKIDDVQKGGAVISAHDFIHKNDFKGLLDAINNHKRSVDQLVFTIKSDGTLKAIAEYE